MEEEDIDLFSQLNFHLEFGIETFSKKMLRIMKKTNNPKNYLHKCQSILNHSSLRELFICSNFMFNYPGETKSTINETLYFLRFLINKIKRPSFLINGQNYAFFPSFDLLKNINWYRQNYGTEVKYVDWWKKNGDYQKLSREIIPSRDLSKGKDFWMLKFQELGSFLLSRLSPRIKLLLWAQVHDLKTHDFWNSKNLVDVLHLI